MKTYSLNQGNLFDEPVEFSYDGFDFTDCVIESQLKKQAQDTEPIYEFVITPVFTINAGTGYANFRLIIPEAVSETLKLGNYVGDFRISRNSPSYGPFNLAPFCINVVKPVTRDS